MEGTCIRCGKVLPKGKYRYCSDFCAKARPCLGCGIDKIGRSPFCVDCKRDRTTGIELTNDPEWKERQLSRDERPKRRPKFAPEGMWWCAGCRTWLSPRWFLTWTALQSGQRAPDRCRPCRSARQHTARIKAGFGMDAEEYERLLKLQGGVCAICGNRPKTARLAVDHDHYTQAVRGLLCKRCNLDLLDALHHSARLASRAALYLATPPAQVGHPVPEGITIPRQALDDLIAVHPWLARVLEPYLYQPPSSSSAVSS